MKKYNVTLYYHTNIDVEVIAENEEDAIELARQEAACDDTDTIDTLLDGMQEDNSPDVEEIGDAEDSVEERKKISAVDATELMYDGITEQSIKDAFYEFAQGLVHERINAIEQEYDIEDACVDDAMWYDEERDAMMKWIFNTIKND